MPHVMHSVTKSITSTFAGILIDEGKIKLDDQQIIPKWWISEAIKPHVKVNPNSSSSPYINGGKILGGIVLMVWEDKRFMSYRIR